jgi:hypothetical protein
MRYLVAVSVLALAGAAVIGGGLIAQPRQHRGIQGWFERLLRRDEGTDLEVGCFYRSIQADCIQLTSTYG